MCLYISMSPDISIYISIYVYIYNIHTYIHIHSCLGGYDGSPIPRSVSRRLLQECPCLQVSGFEGLRVLEFHGCLEFVYRFRNGAFMGLGSSGPRGSGSVGEADG